MIIQFLKDSGLHGLKGSVQYCGECDRQTVHYRTPDGWPICHACGYNENLVQLAADHDEPEMMQPRTAGRMQRRAAGA